jgi:hypothetical protein
MIKTRRNPATEQEKKGIMEEWNIGTMGKKCLNPLFHYSSIPIFLL